MDFKMQDCDFGLTIRDVNYDLEHVNSVNTDNPERTLLTRGANAKNKVGISYTEGSREAKTITVQAMGIPMDLHELLKSVFKSKERIGFYSVNRLDDGTKIANNCVLVQEPMQLVLDDSPESLETSIILQSFDFSEVRKS